jgi:type II secretory pathway component PulF
MLLEPRFSNKALAELCHRLAVESDAGIDIRRTWQREAESAPSRLRPYMAHVRDGVAGGKSMSLALAETGHVFPPLFLEMARVGEESGSLPRVFRNLESHYRRAQQAQRIFLAAIAWPMLELAFAILVIGALIWVLGIVAARNHGEPIDILGFGLIGTKGLIIYVNLVIAVALCIGAVVIALQRGVLWTRPIQRTLLRVPAVGSALEMICLSRLAWALHLTMNTSMDLRRMVPLVLRATGNDHYVRHTDQIVANVAAGHPLHLAFARSGAFPLDFVDAMEVAEESGQTVESMERLSKRYEEEAESAVRMLASIFGFAVGMLVMALIVLMIFRLAGFYFGTINSLLKDTK